MVMDCLDLPTELYWDGKMEPSSPPSTVASDLFSLNETSVANWLFDDNFANDITHMSEDVALDLKHTTALGVLSSQHFEVEFLDFNDEECLLDQKLPQYIDYESNNLQTVIDVVGQPILPITKVQAASPIELYPGQYEAAAELAQLTPPQSPPQCSGSYQQPLRGDQIPLIYDRDSTAIPTAIPVVAANNYNFNSWPNNQATNVSPSNEIERESQLVDEIVKIRAQELQLPNWQQEDYNDDCESQLSSDASISFGDSSSITDEDWQPESSGSSPCYSSGHLHQQTSESAPASPVASSSSSSITSSTATKKRTRTYGRGVEDRKIRKKEQNKNAATRYRQKKKLEMEHVLSEEQELVQQNTKLMRKLSEGKRELKYLRQLIREFHKDQKQ